MTRDEFRKMTQAGPVFLDGATGSNLRAAGMPVGVLTEAWVLEHPEILTELQRAYVRAGSQIVYAPTFGANRANLALYGREGEAGELNRRLVALSQAAAGGHALVAGDITTTGHPVDAPDGFSYEQLIEIYREQALAQAEAGVELFTVETMMGVTEASAAIEAIRSVSDLPVLCTLSLDALGAAYFDGDAETAVTQLPALGADAVGVNCGQGPDVLVNLVSRMAALSEVPVIAKPNAGLPVMQPDGSAVYGMSPGRFARAMAELERAGAGILGGCCGTTPAHIEMLVQQTFLHCFACKRDE